MSERITNELKNIKGTKHNLHEHLKELIARLLLHRGGIDDIESYSFAAKFLLRDEQCVFKIREAYSNLKDYAYKNSVLLAVRIESFRN